MWEPNMLNLLLAQAFLVLPKALDLSPGWAASAGLTLLHNPGMLRCGLCLLLVMWSLPNFVFFKSFAIPNCTLDNRPELALSHSCLAVVILGPGQPHRSTSKATHV